MNQKTLELPKKRNPIFIILNMIPLFFAILKFRSTKNQKNNEKYIFSFTVFFYKKLGSAPSTESFLITHENFAIIVLKVS